MATRKQLAALKKARKAKAMYHKHRIVAAGMIMAHYGRHRVGGNPIPAIIAAHETLQKIRPFSAIENAANAIGLKAALDKRYGNSKIYQGIKKVGNFLTGTLGYGRKHKKSKRTVRGRGSVHRRKSVHKRRSTHRRPKHTLGYYY